MSDAPEPVERDSRGILGPWQLRQRVTLTRYPSSPALEGLVDRFWAVRWGLPDGVLHEQQVLTHPGVNLSVGHPDSRLRPGGPVEARCAGVARRLTTRALAGAGWTVAAMTTPGGFGAFTDTPVSRFTDRVVPWAEALGGDEAAFVRQVDDAGDEAARVAVVADALEAARRPDRIADARRVAGLARRAETDRSIRRLDELCEAAGVGPRTLQRLFLRYAGVSPTWVVRRYRLLEAAEAVRDGQQVSWADVAVELGYADQAHLIREFHAATGRTPAAYARSQR